MASWATQPVKVFSGGLEEGEVILGAIDSVNESLRMGAVLWGCAENLDCKGRDSWVVSVRLEINKVKDEERLGI